MSEEVKVEGGMYANYLPEKADYNPYLADDNPGEVNAGNQDSSSHTEEREDRRSQQAAQEEKTQLQRILALEAKVAELEDRLKDNEEVEKKEKNWTTSPLEKIDLESFALPSFQERNQVDGVDHFWIGEYQKAVADSALVGTSNEMFDWAATFFATAEKAAKAIAQGEDSNDGPKLGGLAGGKKLVRDGILFKVADDPEVEKSWFLLGGSQPDQFLANKVASIELKGCAAYSRFFKSQNINITVPPQILFDFCGWRMVAMPYLPVKDAIIYGSDDAGKHVHNDWPAFSQAMEQAAQHYHLAGHPVVDQQGRKVTVFSAGDVEGHLGKDGLAYLLDLGRAFPPEATTPHLVGPSSPFFRMLRPERLMQLAETKDGPTLSCDTFSGWGAFQPKEHRHNLCDATKRFCCELVPKFAQSLDDSAAEGSRKWLFSTDFSLTSSLFHSNGVNMRHLGLVLSFSKEPALQLHLLREVAARALKAIFREQLRTSGTTELRMRQVVVTFLNALDSPSATSNNLWSQLASVVGNNYGSLCFRVFPADQVRLLLRPWLGWVVHYLLQTCGIKVKADAVEKFSQRLPSAWNLAGLPASVHCPSSEIVAFNAGESSSSEVFIPHLNKLVYGRHRVVVEFKGEGEGSVGILSGSSRHTLLTVTQTRTVEFEVDLREKVAIFESRSTEISGMDAVPFVVLKSQSNCNAATVSAAISIEQLAPAQHYHFALSDVSELDLRAKSDALFAIGVANRCLSEVFALQEKASWSMNRSETDRADALISRAAEVLSSSIDRTRLSLALLGACRLMQGSTEERLDDVVSELDELQRYQELNLLFGSRFISEKARVFTVGTLTDHAYTALVHLHTTRSKDEALIISAIEQGNTRALSKIDVSTFFAAPPEPPFVEAYMGRGLKIFVFLYYIFFVITMWYLSELYKDDKATYAGPLLAFALVSLVPLMFYGMFILVEFFCGEPKKPHKFSALQMAAFYGNVDSVVFLLQNGQDIAFRDKDTMDWGTQCGGWCCVDFCYCFFCVCLEFEFLYCGKRSKPMTAEMIAKRRGHLEVASILKGYRQGKQLRTSTVKQLQSRHKDLGVTEDELPNKKTCLWAIGELPKQQQPLVAELKEVKSS